MPFLVLYYLAIVCLAGILVASSKHLICLAWGGFQEPLQDYTWQQCFVVSVGLLCVTVLLGWIATLVSRHFEE